MRHKLLVIDDNPDYGGHQVMTAHGVEGLLEFGNWEILALIDRANAKNLARWNEIEASAPPDAFSIQQAATQTRKFQAVRNRWQAGKIQELARQISAFNPDLVLVIQGNIEQSCAVFSLKESIACPLVSYIPVPHTHHEMGAKLGRLRDYSCRKLYRIPDGFITISPTLGSMLSDYGATGRIQIVENGIPLRKFAAQPTKEEARTQFGLPQHGFIWGQIGRIEFKQKGQDVALAAFLERSKSFPDESLVFLGGGPDADSLQERVSGTPNVHCLPWTDNPAPLYAALDCLMLPSRYEGVPLVMLEALANKVPVIATDRDGMRDWLPEAWRFPYGDVTGLLGAMDRVSTADNEMVEGLSQRVYTHNDLTSFQKAFNEALEAWL